MIWCVEDDASIRDIETYTLQSTGFESRGFSEGESFFKALEEERPDLVILDVMLPGAYDGITILKKLKSNHNTASIPVIMATAKGMEYEKIQSLDLGADDYLVKPFGMMEMVARVKAVLRRCAPASSQNTICANGITMDLDKRTVCVGNDRIELTYKEFEILRLFMSSIGVVFTRDRLFNEVWGEDYLSDTRTIDMHIRTLRQKLGECGKSITTVRNVGYRMENENI